MSAAASPSPAPSPDASDRRDQMLAATVAVVVERGYEATDLAAIAGRAGVREDDLAVHFDDKAVCCVAAFDAIVARFETSVRAAARGQASWRDGLRAAAYAAADFLRDNEREARFSLYELFRADGLPQARRDEVLQVYVDLIDGGRAETEDSTVLSRSSAEIVVGSILGLLIKRVPQRGFDGVEDLIPELMYLAVRPYLGHEVALQELSIPRPAGGSARD